MLPADITILFTSRASIGVSAILRKEGTTNQGFQSLVVRQGCDTYFLYSQTPKIKRYAEKRAAGSTFLEISGKILGQCPLSVPSLPEQRKVGCMFRQLDTLIFQQQEKINKLKVLKKALLGKLFPQSGQHEPELRFAGFKGEWDDCTVGDISEYITKGTSPFDKSGKGEINFIKVESLNAESGKIEKLFKVSVEEHEGRLARSQLVENDVLFSIAGTLGRVCVVPRDVLPANTNQALAIIRTKEVDVEYLEMALTGNMVFEYIRKNPTIGAQPNLSLFQISRLRVHFPRKEEQQRIGTIFRFIDQLITLHRRRLAKLQHLKKAMLAEMFASP